MAKKKTVKTFYKYSSHSVSPTGTGEIIEDDYTLIMKDSNSYKECHLKKQNGGLVFDRKDGPAIIFHNNKEEYWLNGDKLTKEEFWDAQKNTKHAGKIFANEFGTK